jgi:acetyltransferase-like isoleucine patch superfamily enzyme
MHMNRAAPLQFAADEQALGTFAEAIADETPAPATTPELAPSPPTRWTRNLRRLLQEPSLVKAVLNAQIRLRSIAGLPLSTRLIGRARICGGRRIVFGERVFILGGTVPVEIAALGTGRIEIGEGTSINYGASLAAYELVSIGRMCRIGQYVIINDNDFHDIEDKEKLPPSKPVVIEDGVWLGARVIVQKGVRIGHDAVVGAGSVVTRDIPPRCVAAGMPARVVRWF